MERHKASDLKLCAIHNYIKNYMPVMCFRVQRLEGFFYLHVKHGKDIPRAVQRYMKEEQIFLVRY